jgi:2-polyprenyl-6-methoxyphenol hydroxylase-like FAD-dependent oxidoreductase
LPTRDIMNAAAVETVNAQCCIVGGGPAGMMLGFLLARAGVNVAVLEKHGDFLRDFRGDTIHPSTLDVIHELGLLDKFLARPHQELKHLGGWIGEHRLTLADFSHLPTYCKFLAFMPQWDFLDFLADEARRYPTFQLRMNAEMTDLIRDGETVSGVAAETATGPLRVMAKLVVGCDGRTSKVRERAGLEVIDLGAPMDVLWMRISKCQGDPTNSLGRISRGHILALIDRGDYWQCGFVIPKGGIEEWKRRGLPALREEISLTAPFFGERAAELKTWDDVKLLTVKVDRLQKWHQPGLLCIGDAAHAMSPVGGVGINLAIQDAVAAANLLAEPLFTAKLTEAHLRAVESRRERPTRWTQRLQILIQNRIIRRILGGATTENTPTSLPWLLQLSQTCPRLQRIPARIIGIGFRPEHVQTPLRPPQP